MVVPPKHPKMIISSRKNHGCWGNPPFKETSTTRPCSPKSSAQATRCLWCLWCLIYRRRAVGVNRETSIHVAIQLLSGLGHINFDPGVGIPAIARAATVLDVMLNLTMLKFDPRNFKSLWYLNMWTLMKKNIQTYPTVDKKMKIPTINQLKTQHNWAMFVCFWMLVQVATILSSHIPSDKLFPRFPQR